MAKSWPIFSIPLTSNVANREGEEPMMVFGDLGFRLNGMEYKFIDTQPMLIQDGQSVTVTIKRSGTVAAMTVTLTDKE